MIGISEGMILAERYRLVRRHEDLGIGEFWGGVDQETGSEVWVSFADHPGLNRVAEAMQQWKSAAVPRILDSGEVRLILDSRTLGVAGAAGRAATHVEVVVEFAVQAPALGKPLPGRIARRALPPAEALTLVALLAEALDEALAAGYSHGWLSAASAWSVRRRVCLVDLAAGLTRPDDAQMEMAAKVAGYMAPERIAGGAASEATDVFALGWLLYASLAGVATLDALHRETVAAAGSVSTAELLALWRERSREHVATLLPADSALLALLLGALAEHAADRPTLAAFRAAAGEAGRALAGAEALVAYLPRGAKAAGVVAADAALGAAVGVAAALAAEDLAAGYVAAADVAASGSVAAAGDVAAGDVAASGSVAGAGGAAAVDAADAALVAAAVEATDDAAASELAAGELAAAGVGIAAVGALAGAAVAETVVAENLAAESVATETASAGNVATGGTAAGSTAAGNVAEVGGASSAVGGLAMESESVAVVSAAEGLPGGGGSSGGGSVLSLEERRARHRPRAGLLAAAAVGLLAIGLGSGYAFGASGKQSAGSAEALACAPSTSSAASVAALAAAEQSQSESPSPSQSPSTAAAAISTATSAPAASTSAPAVASSSATWNSSVVLPVPTSTGQALSQLTSTVSGAESSGLLSQSTASHLQSGIAAVRQAVASGSGYLSAVESLSLAIRSGQSQGTIPQALSVQLSTTLSYLYGSVGS